MRQQVYFETLLLELYCCCEDYVKYGIITKILVSKKKNKRQKLTTNFYKKIMTSGYYTQ